MYRKLLIGLLILIVSGCSSIHIEKRRYTKGYYLTINKRLKSSDAAMTKDTLAIAKSERQVNEAEIHASKRIEKAQKSSSLEPESLSNSKIHSSEMSRREVKKAFEITKDEAAAFNDVKTINATKKSIKKNSEKGLSGLWYFLSLSLIPLIIKRKNSIHKASLWASKNKKASRLLIVLFSSASISSNFLLGNILQPEVSSAMYALPIMLGASALFLNQKRISGISSFIKSKIAYSLVSISALFGSFSAGAMYSPLNSSSNNTGDDPFILPVYAMVLLTLLLILICILLAYFTLILSCSLSCNGQEVAAAFVLIGGIALILFLLSFGLYMIFRRESRRKYEYKVVG